MLFRTAEEKDVESLKELGLASYGELKKYMSPENWDKMATLIRSKETLPKLVTECFSFVCELEAQLAGMAFLVPSGNPTKIYSTETSYIRMVGVRPSATGKGIAHRLTQLCIDKARETGEQKISLHSAEVMYAARHVYEKLGFQKKRLLDEHYGLVYWLYELDLIS